MTRLTILDNVIFMGQIDGKSSGPCQIFLDDKKFQIFSGGKDITNYFVENVVYSFQHPAEKGLLKKPTNYLLDFNADFVKKSTLHKHLFKDDTWEVDKYIIENNGLEKSTITSSQDAAWFAGAPKLTIGKADLDRQEAKKKAEKVKLDAEEQTKLAAEKEQAEKIETEKAKLATEKEPAEKTKLSAEKESAEKANLAAEKEAAEKAQIAAEKEAAEKATLAAEKEAAEKTKLSAEKEAAEQANLTAEKEAAEKATLAAEKEAAEKATLAAEKEAAEKAKIAAEKEAAEQAENEKAAAKKAAAAKLAKEQAAKDHPESELTAGKYIAAVALARDKYKKWHDLIQIGTIEKDVEASELRGKHGFFSRFSFRHGISGQTRANNLVNRISRAEKKHDLLYIQNEITTLLTDSNTRYNRHSFSSFLLDELKNVGYLGLEATPNDLYSKKDIIARVAKQKAETAEKPTSQPLPG